jgi:hypothetical protein
MNGVRFWWGERTREPFTVVVSSLWLDRIGAQRQRYIGSSGASPHRNAKRKMRDLKHCQQSSSSSKRFIKTEDEDEKEDEATPRPPGTQRGKCRLKPRNMQNTRKHGSAGLRPGVVVTNRNPPNRSSALLSGEKENESLPAVQGIVTEGHFIGPNVSRAETYFTNQARNYSRLN